MCAVVAMSGCVSASLETDLLENDQLETRGKNDRNESSITSADRKVAVEVDESRSDRRNASGPKITSNAHSDEFPGMLFIWDCKQKDNGYLKVESWVFEKFESFTLTSKEANNYWDFKIEPQRGQKMTKDGHYVYFIPKVCGNNKINMVFIGDFVRKEAPVQPDPEPVLTEYVTTILSGVDFGVEVTGSGADGKPIQGSMDMFIDRDSYPFDEIASADPVKFQEFGPATWAWDEATTLQTGYDGETIEYNLEFTVEGTDITDYKMAFAADNAIMVWLNGAVMANTSATTHYDSYSDNISVADGTAWWTVYQPDTDDFVNAGIRQGVNTLRILARNASNDAVGEDPYNTDADRFGYDTSNNGAGVLFAFMVKSQSMSTPPVEPGDDDDCDNRHDCDRDHNDCDRDRNDCDRDNDRNDCKDKDKDKHDNDRCDNDRDNDRGNCNDRDNDRDNCNDRDNDRNNDRGDNCNDRNDSRNNNGKDKNKGNDKRDNGKGNDRDRH